MQERYRFTEMTAAEQIHRWKAEKNAVILAHYYVRPEIQEIADYVGDSYFLSEKAAELDAEIIVLCGVSFMGESAKILNTEKILITTGAVPSVPPIPGVDAPGVVTSDELLNWNGPLLQRLVIIGGGVIGMECVNVLQI